MSPRPDTRPLGDNFPDFKLESTGERSSISSLVKTIIDNSTNKPLPWVVLLAIVATAALCLSCWSLWVNLDNRRILAERVADEKTYVAGVIAMANQSAEVRDREIRDELRLNRNHVDQFDNRVIVLTKLEENYHAGRHTR